MFEDIKSKEYYVCYFDILGQKNAMRPLYEKDVEITKELHVRIDDARASFQRNAGLFAIAREGCLSGLQRGS